MRPHCSRRLRRQSSGRRGELRRTFACLVAGLALFLVHASGAWAADKTLDLKVLVISTGNASVDPGLDLMDDVLNEVGVPYDVLDSSTEVLTPGRLSRGDHGFYNGVILTNSELFLPDGTGSGFNFLEWDVLHAFERDFGVRESVLSGFPATNPGLGLDYGMTDIIAGNDFQGIWQAPAGGTEIFEYVNEANPLPITDFAFAGRPFVDLRRRAARHRASAPTSSRSSTGGTTSRRPSSRISATTTGAKCCSRRSRTRGSSSTRRCSRTSSSTSPRRASSSARARSTSSRTWTTSSSRTSSGIRPRTRST